MTAAGTRFRITSGFDESIDRAYAPAPMTKKTRVLSFRQPRYLHVRASPFHGLGVFTTRAIPSGTRLLEYLGERISHVEATERYYGSAEPEAFVLLFAVDRATVIDGGELTYDYRVESPRPAPRDWRRRYSCRCGTHRCRGTMLVRPPRPRSTTAGKKRRSVDS